MIDMKITKKQINKLSKKEKKIYNSVLENFPATSREYAYDIAIQGGIKFQFMSKI